MQRNVLNYLMENVSNVGVIGLDQSVGVVLPVRFKMTAVEYCRG